MLAVQPRRPRKDPPTVNSLCVPILVYRENVRENPFTAQKKKERLRESSRAPFSCLLGTIERLSENIAHLPPDAWLKDNTQKPPDRWLKPSPQPTSTGQQGKDRADKGQSKPGRPASPSASSQSLLQTRRSDAPTQKRDQGMPKLLELFQFPGLNRDGPTPLPHNTSYSAVVGLVVRAQRHLAHRPRYRMVFQNILSSAAMEDFVLDFFWWLFLQSFQPDAGVQDSLFARVAEGYMQILGQHLASQSGSQFLREFPSTLAQTLYCCFISSFPQSAGTIRTDSFLLTVCFTAYQWTGGLCPAPDAHARWDLEALEPEEARNVVLVSSEKEDKDEDSCLSLLDTMFSDSGVEPGHSQSSVALLSKKISRTTQGSSQASLKSQRLSSGSRVTVKEEKAGGPDITGHDLKGLTSEETQKPTIESHVAYPATEFERVMFDLRGNSPLVKFYLDQANRSPCRGSQLVPRTQIHKLPPELLTEAQEHWAHHSRDLGAMRGQYAQDLYNLHHKKLDERYRFHRKQKKVLSQKSMVRRLCQLLVPEGNEEDLRARSDVIRLFETTLSGLD